MRDGKEMILTVVVLFGVFVAALGAWLIKGKGTASITAGCVTLLLPYLALLYVGHPVADVTLLDLLFVSLGSSALVIGLKRAMQRQRHPIDGERSGV
jgi:hypothetical protein